MMRKNEGYREQQITPEDVKRLNFDEIERVERVPNLFVSLKQAVEGDTYNLERQIYRKYFLHKDSLHTEIRFIDKKLNNLSIRMKKKYADSEMVSNEALQIGSSTVGATISRRAFIPEEIDDMLVSFIFNFNDRIVDIGENVSVNVPSIYSFKKEDDAYSYNSLMSYIVGKNGKPGVFENSLLKVMEIEKGTIPHMINGVSTKINLNDLDVISYEDIDTPEDVDGNKMLVDDLIGQEDYKTEQLDRYQSTKEFAYIQNNLKNVLTNNQVEKLEELFKAIRIKKTSVDKLLHPITNELIKAELGRIWFPGEPNNYVQSAVEDLLIRMKNRMEKAIKLQGFKNDVTTLKSDYRKLKNHSLVDNKLFSDYKIWDRYVIRDIELTELHKDIAIKIQNTDQFIPMVEIEKIKKNEQTVTDLIKKYQLTKKNANNPHGVVKTYVIDLENGKPLFTEQEIKEREDKHCRQLLEWIRNNDITFTPDSRKNGYMKSSSHKLHSVSDKDYLRLIESSMNDEKLEIIRKYMNREYFNTTNKYVLRETCYVDYKENQYVDRKNYDIEKYIEEIEHEEIKEIKKII